MDSCVGKPVPKLVGVASVVESLAASVLKISLRLHYWTETNGFGLWGIFLNVKCSIYVHVI